jgi:hypothetical protein
MLLIIGEGNQVNLNVLSVKNLYKQYPDYDLHNLKRQTVFLGEQIVPKAEGIALNVYKQF